MHSEPFNAIRSTLPDRHAIGLSVEDQARSVLHLLLDICETAAEIRITPPDYLRCANCENRCDSITSPFCSPNCRDQAAFIRQFRAAVATASILLPEKQIVFGERLWWLLGGGLPMRESRIPESAKRQVTKRSGGACEFCGAAMTAIENFGSGCNRPLHLRAVCTSCSKTKSYDDGDFARRPEVVALLIMIGQRVVAPSPVRLCDDHENWDWREYIALRRQAGGQ